MAQEVTVENLHEGDWTYVHARFGAVTVYFDGWHHPTQQWHYFLTEEEARAFAQDAAPLPVPTPVLPGQTWEPEGEGDFVEYTPAADAWAGDPDRMTRREAYAL